MLLLANVDEYSFAKKRCMLHEVSMSFNLLHQSDATWSK